MIIPFKFSEIQIGLRAVIYFHKKFFEYNLPPKAHPHPFQSEGHYKTRSKQLIIQFHYKTLTPKQPAHRFALVGGASRIFLD